MSEFDPTEGSSPLEGLPFFAELARIPSGDRPVNWDVARRVAVWVAGGGQPEPPVDPVVGDELRELGRVAELHVVQAIPASLAPAFDEPVAVRAVTRGEWAVRALDLHGPLLESLAVSLARSRPPDTDSRPAGLAPPVLEGLVFGWMMGQLARRALGQYDPPLPGPHGPRLSIVVANLDDIAVEWSLPVDEVRLWACLQDVFHHAVLAQPHVRDTLNSLLRRYVDAFEVESDAFAEELEAVDPSDPSSFRTELGEPEALLAAVHTPAQAELVAQLEALSAVLEGWVGRVAHRVGQRLLSSYPSLHEVVRRRRAEASWGDRYVAKLLGMGLRQQAHERGRRFVTGIVLRAGEDVLDRLWASERDLPTPAEVDAPGLWLARIELPNGN